MSIPLTVYKYDYHTSAIAVNVVLVMSIPLPVDKYDYHTSALPGIQACNVQELALTLTLTLCL